MLDDDDYYALFYDSHELLEVWKATHHIYVHYCYLVLTLCAFQRNTCIIRENYLQLQT